MFCPEDLQRIVIGVIKSLADLLPNQPLVSPIFVLLFVIGIEKTSSLLSFDIFRFVGALLLHGNITRRVHDGGVSVVVNVVHCYDDFGIPFHQNAIIILGIVQPLTFRRYKRRRQQVIWIDAFDHLEINRVTLRI